ncbi:autotransporter-associated beta strand repeat-containing protein [Prosthecobacter sp. SYSU 5D2]|uniref:autotransporter-associated beta strand repeat-containing protein n=1 Tax=Prosthecobacter sp. SYSU 5D2 TaxID=3134134 RepID=UPI0031FE94B9
MTSFLVLAGGQVSAQTPVNWVGQGTGGFDWQSVLNWDTGTVPNAIGAGAVLGFTPGGTQTISLNGAVTLGSLQFSNERGGRFVLAPGTGGSLVFNSGTSTATLLKTGNGTSQISAPISLTENLTAQINQGTMILSGVISGTGFGLVKNGDGMLVLSSGNTFTGGNVLNGGITLVNVATTGLGSTAQSTVVNSGATLALSTATGAAGMNMGSKPISIEGNGYLGMGAIRNMLGVNTNTVAGAITMQGAALIQSDSTGGAMTLSGALGVDHALRLHAFASLNFDSLISGSADITKYGMGYLRFQNAGNTYSGSISATLGELRSKSNGAGGYNSVSAFNMTNGLLYVLQESGAAINNDRYSDTSTITLNGSRIRMQTVQTLSHTETLGPVTFQNGGNVIDMRSVSNGQTQELILTSLTRGTAGSTILFNLDGVTSGGQQLGAGTQSRILDLGAPAMTHGILGGWATTRLTNTAGEFVKYGANGYTALVAGDYSIDTAQTGWASTQNVKLTAAATLTGDRTINSLNMYSDTGRTLDLGGNTLTVDSGGVLISRGASVTSTHTISNGNLTAGPGPGATYELFLHHSNASLNLSAVIVDNGANPVSLVKTGPNLLSLLNTQLHTGKTFINEGQLRERIGYAADNSAYSALGGGNLHIQGSVIGQSTFDTDRDILRALGSGAGQVQITGGSGGGFGAFGRAIQVNFGGAEEAVVWGSAYFNPSMFTLNGGTATHALTLVNPLDLGGQQRYIRLDGAASGAGRGAIGRFENDVYNGGIVKRGGGTLLIDSAKTYKSGTLIDEGLVWVRGSGNLGADIVGNDVQVGAAGALHLESPGHIGVNQRIFLQNASNDNASAIGFGAGYGDGSGISFQSFTATGGGLQDSGGNNIFIANNQAGNARNVAVQMNGMGPTSVDFTGMIAAVAPNVRVWFGATSANGIFTGDTLSPTGHGAGDLAFRLGSGGGTLTIQKANVLNGALPLFIGAIDHNARSNIGGAVYLPEAQNYSGQLTIGSGGLLVAGRNGALSTGNNTINLRAGELRVSVAAGLYSGIDNQYAARNIDVSGGNAILRVESLNGAGGSLVSMGTLRMDGADRVLTVTSTTTRQNGVLFLGKTTLNHTAAGNTLFDVGIDNQGFNSGFLYLMGEVEQTGTGNRALVKRLGGTLVLGAANTYAGITQLQQGNLVLSHTSAAGLAGTINMAVNSDRTARLQFLINGAGPHHYNYGLNFTSGTNNSNRIVTVGPASLSTGNANQEVQVSSITWAALSGVTNFDLITDGSHGYRFTVNGNVTLSRDINFRTRGALTTINGQITGGFNVLKGDQGTLWLKGANTYTGSTTVNNGYLVLDNDNALGGTSAVTFGSTASSQILLAGERTLSRNITNSATGGLQTLGGLDAGAKTFSGNVVTTRAVNVSAVTGGDVSFTGTVSAAGGINKVGNGKVVLNPAAGTGNTYTGPTVVTAGTLIGKAQATSGSPFGVNSAFTLGNGILQFDGLAGANGSATSTGALNIAGGSRLVINDQANDAFTTTLGFGSLTRAGGGTVTFVPQLGNLGTQENITFSSAPALTNGIIGTWAVAAASGSSNAADYLTTTGSGPYRVVTATYGGTGNLDTATGSTQVFNAGTTPSTLTDDRAVYAFRTDANVNLAGFTLNVGSGGQAGIILNNGASITGNSGSALNFGNNLLSLYVDDAATSSISVALTNVRDNSTNVFSTNAEPAVNTAPVFVKFGRGTLELNAAASFQGGILVSEGTLRAGAANVFPTFRNLNASTGSIVTIAPGATVDLNGFDQEFGNLSGPRAGAEFQFSGGTLDLGSATLTIGRESPGTTSTQTFSGQIIGGVDSKIIKVGTGRLVFDNINGSLPNSLETLEISQGIVRTWLNDQSWATPTSVASALPSSTTVLLRGGEWEAWAIGDSTTNQQTIFIGNNVVHQGADSILDSNRPTGAGGNKLLIMGSLTLDLQRFLTTGGNTYIPRFDGQTTLTHHARIQTDSQLVLAGGVSDGGSGYTMNKTGASDLTIDGDNSATWSGGLVVTQGTVYFGTRGADEIRSPGVTLAFNSQANAGTGDIIINQGFTTTTAIRLMSPDNVLTAQGQRVQTFGSEASGTIRIDIGTDAKVSDYGLRSTTNGSLSLGLGDGGLYTHALDQAAMGSGRWGISAFQGSTYYMPSTLGAGFDDIYRFSGTNAGILSLLTPNLLTGDNAVVLGRSPVNVGNVPTGSQSQVRTYGGQNFTGNTIIHRGADFGSVGNLLSFHGDYATPEFEVYGRLEARGDGRFTNDAGDQVNKVILRPGGALRLDYLMDVNDQFVVSRQDNSNLGLYENKWGDTTPIILDGAQLGLINHSGRVNQEVVGEITVKGGAGILMERSGTNGQSILITNDGIERSGQALLSIRNTTAAELGSAALQSQKIFINDPAWVTENMNNGMFNPWMLSVSNLSYLGYNNDTGLVNVPFTTGTGATFLAGLTNTSIAHYSTAGNATLTGTVNAYALRLTGTTTLTGHQINIHSGGLITNGAVTLASNLYFGSGSAPVEGIIFSADSTLTVNGVLTAANLTRGGPSTLTLANTGNNITGNIQINGGTLIANAPGTLGSASTITLHADYFNNNNGSQMPLLSLRTASASGTYNHKVVVAENVPIARIELNRSSGSGNGTISIGSLDIKGTEGAAGTLLQIENANSYNFTVNGATTVGGTSDVGIRVSAGTALLTGDFSSAAGITKSGNGTLRMNGNNAGFTGGMTVNRGEWYTMGNTSDAGGSGDVVSNFGAIRMANTSGTAGSRFDAEGQTLTLNGQTTLITQRVGSTNAHITIGAANNGNVLTTNNSPWIIFQSASFGDQINIHSSVVINDAPWLRVDSAFTLLRNGSVVSGEGKINKAGNYLLGFDNNAANTYTGGTDIWAGELNVRQINATLGTGAVRLYPGAALSVRNVGNLGTAGLTQIVTSASSFSVFAVRNNDGGNAQFDAVTAAAAMATIHGNGNGVLALGGGRNYTADLDMANRDGGAFASWWLGGVEGSGTISSNTLSAWGPGGNEFRLGGGHNGTITMNPVTGNSDQLSGAGNRLLIGGGQITMAYGTVTLGANSNNTFDGGTLISRTRDSGGAFRGAVLNIQAGQVNATTYRTAVGTGTVDVFGDLRIEGSNGTARNSDTGNANAYVFHPGSRIRFDNGTAFGTADTQGRWADSAGIALNTSVIEIFGDDTNSVYNSETIGAISVSGGSEIVLRRRGANWSELSTGDITRSGSGTLMVTTIVDNTTTLGILGTAGTASATRLLAANGASLMDNNMVVPWITSRTDGQFLKYDATLGFQLITQGGAPDNYLAVTNTTPTLTPGSVITENDGTEILSLQGSSNFTLGGDLDVYALRLERDININAGSGFDRITIRSGGLIQVANTPTINADLYFGPSVEGDGDGEAFVSASNNTLQLNGRIYASQFTKSGSAFVNIRSDQSQFTGDWVVNGGGIQFLTPGAASTGEVILNGSRANDRDNTFNTTEVRYNFNPGSPDVFTWSGGDITAYDFNRIYAIAGSDRTIQVPAIDLRTTNTVAGTGQEGTVILRMDGLRSTMRTGTVTLHDHYLLHVETDRAAPGATTGVQLGHGDGTGGLNNQGLYDVRKTGIGMLTLGDNSATFTGSRSFTVGDGGVRVMHNGAFGNASINATINPTGTLEIAVANWSPTATLTQAWGSTERWAVNEARGSGDYSLPSGVHLQIMANQTGTRTINLNGGSIMGYLPLDWEQVAVNHTLGSGITVNLTADSLLGQLYPAGTSNAANHFLYDMGKLNTTTNLNPNDPGLRGSYLHIDGNITGDHDLTKVGQDIILLNGSANSFRNTNIENGILQIGRNNTLPVTTELTTRFSGMFDLNGYDQEVAALQGTGGSVHNGGFDYNTLTVNQAGDTTYGGQIHGSTHLVKSGEGDLALSSASSSYVGNTFINAGRLLLTGDGAVNETPWIRMAAGTGLDVSGRTGGSYEFDGVISGGGVGAQRADNTSRGIITGSLVVKDAVGLASRSGRLAPGLSSTSGLATAGDMIGHLQITQNLTLAAGTAILPVERLTLQLGGSTTTLAALGWAGGDVEAFLQGLATGTADQMGVLDGTFGDLSLHDYINVGGTLEFNQHGTIRVDLLTGYSPGDGAVFNLLDWNAVLNSGFDAGTGNRAGGGYENTDLYLPTLGEGLFWNTSLFTTHGIIVVVPEPGRVLLLMAGLGGVFFRRRRK